MAIKTLINEGTGQYGMRCGRTLCWDEDTMLGVLIQDWYGGQDSLEGGMYRPYLYQLPADLTQTAITAWDNKCTLRDAVGDWEGWWHDNCGREALQVSQRYYGNPEEALHAFMLKSEV